MTITPIRAPRSHERPLAMLTAPSTSATALPLPAPAGTLTDPEPCTYCGGRRPAEGLPSPDHIIRDLLATHRKQCDCITAHGRRDLALDDQIRDLLSDLDAADRLAHQDARDEQLQRCAGVCCDPAEVAR
ncbi:hypothetical protein [Brachybacterium phenoliresistens]|uniref:hypothetical protein n=1 Tax=Brachybacterium phenoliresistens TaxID=396014 RepID=UPI0031D6D0E9